VNRRETARLATGLAALVGIGCASQAPASRPVAPAGADPGSAQQAPATGARSKATKAPGIDDRIAYFERQLAAQPRLYPALVQLGEAYLDKASETHDPSWIGRARQALERSLAIQPTFEAYLLHVRLGNHTHRFKDALLWGQRAVEASVNGSFAIDPMLVPALVEAHMGLGQDDEARKLLPPRAAEADSYHTAVAGGHYLAARDQPDQAVAAFLRAAALAEKREPAMAAWACVRAAGVLLDSGRAVEARPHLDRARAVDPSGKLLRLHQAELELAERRPAEALRLYEDVLAESPDPDVHHQAYRVARQLGDAGRTRRHFEAAERGFLRAISAGEVYTLGGLAQLYLEAGVKLDEALALARRNLEWKRDAEARATLEALEAKRTPRASAR
jgi:tetratricopeptide (TPR) repeat protein